MTEIDRALKALGSAAILGGDIPDIEVMPTESKALNDDILACGGLPRGRAVEVYAKSSVGKCLAADTLVPTEHGMVQISDLCPDEVPEGEWTKCAVLLGTKSGTSISSRLYHQGWLETLKIETAWGFRVEGGKDSHRILTMTEEGETGFRLLKDLKQEDYVGIRYGTEIYGTQDHVGSFVLDADTGYLLGTLAGDGYNRDSRLQISCHKKDEFIVEEVDRILGEKLNLSLRFYEDKRNPEIWRCKKADSKIKDLFNDVPEIVRRSHQKEIPTAILRAPKKVQIGFLQGLFDTDGSASATRLQVSYSSVSREMITQIQTMLLNMGVIPRIDRKKTKWQNGSGTTLRLRVLGSMAVKFAQTVGFRLKRKQETLEREIYANPKSSVFDRIPSQKQRLMRIAESSSNRRPDGFSTRIKRNPWVSKKEIQDLLEHYHNQEHTEDWQALNAITRMPIAWFPITSIRESQADCWDLEVPEEHNFVSNGFISHNSTFCQWLAGQVQNQEWTLSFRDGTEVTRQGTVCWFDAERSLMKDYAHGSGMELSQVVIPDFGLGNDLLYKLKQAVALDAFDLIVLDSIQAVIPDEIADIKGGRSMNQRLAASKMWAQFFNEIQGGFKIRDADGKLIKSKSPEYVYNVGDDDEGRGAPKEGQVTNFHRLGSKKCCLVFINHARTKISTGFARGEKTYTPGGDEKDFAFAIRIELRHKGNKMGKRKGERLLKWRDVEFKSTKNKMGIPLRSHEFGLDPEGHLILDKSDITNIETDVEAAVDDEEEDAIEALKRKLKDKNGPTPLNTSESADAGRDSGEEDEESEGSEEEG